MQSRSLLLSLLSTVTIIAACGGNGETTTELGSGGEPGSGGTQGTGGISPTGGTAVQGTGGAGHGGTGGTTPTGGVKGTGGAPSTGGIDGSGTGGNGSGGTGPIGGRTGGGGQAGATTAIGGRTGGGGRTGMGSGGTTGGTTGGGGSTSTATSTSTSVALDCTAPTPAMPSGGTQHSGNGRGGSGNLAWEIWTNSGTGKMTTFSVPAFSASWGGTGDYLGRLGFEWGNSGKAYTSYGTITADFTFKKSGSGGGFSYIGIYGWSGNPCVEYYILDDSMGSFPFNPYNSSQKGTATIDGETYKLFSNQTNGTGGSRCNASSWTQHWSIRQKARQCGTITISDHFKAWDGAGMKMGTLMEAKILVETGGGSGTVDFPIANLKTSQ